MLCPPWTVMSNSSTSSNQMSVLGKSSFTCVACQPCCMFVSFHGAGPGNEAGSAQMMPSAGSDLRLMHCLLHPVNSCLLLVCIVHVLGRTHHRHSVVTCCSTNIMCTHPCDSMSHPCVYICVTNVCIAPAWLKKCLHQDIPLCLMHTMAAGVCQGNEASSSGQGALQKGTLTVGLSFEPIHDSLHTTYLLSCTSFQQQGLCKVAA